MRLESTFENFVSNELLLSDDQSNEMSLGLGSLIDGLKFLDSYIDCESETQETTREISTQTDISGLILIENIFHY